MKKLRLPAAAAAALALLFLLYPAAPSPAKPLETVTDGIQVDLLVDGLKRFDQAGLYRVVDSGAKKIIYVLNTNQMGSNPQIFVVSQ